MERLTYRDSEGHANWRKELLEDNTGASGEMIRNTLADYEDTGLEPQEITRIVDEYGHGHTLRTHAAERLELIREIPTDRLRELVEAEREQEFQRHLKRFDIMPPKNPR